MESVSARLPDDVAEQLEQYAERRGISQSEAVRRLIVAGMEQQELERRIDKLEWRVGQLEDRPYWWPW